MWVGVNSMPGPHDTRSSEEGTLLAVLNNQKARGAVIQATFVGVIAVVILSAIAIGRANMEQRGITVGFDFLRRSTGWDITFSLLDYSLSDTYARALLIGALNTILLGAIIIVGSTIIGVFVGTARLSKNRLLAFIAGTYVEIIRNIPLLLQALFWYSVCTHLPPARQALAPLPFTFLTNRGIYFPALNVTALSIIVALGVVAVATAAYLWSLRSRRAGLWAPQQRNLFRIAIVIGAALLVAAVLGLGRLDGTDLVSLPQLAGLNFRQGMRIPPEFLAAIISTVLFGGAYIAEIVRAGLLSVPRGQSEAGLSLGLSPSHVFWRIRLPLAIRFVLPTLTNQYVWLMKATTIGIVIGFNDFFMIVANSINKSGQTISLIGILIVGFWILNFSLAGVLNLINRTLAIRGAR